jgi:hypothetical protein
VSRNLEAGHLVLRPVAEFLLTKGASLVQYNKGRVYLLQPRIGHADHLRLPDGRVPVQDILDFFGRDVLPANANDVLQPSREGEAPSR